MSEREVLLERVLEMVFQVTSNRRGQASLRLLNGQSLSLTPYANTEAEAFCYWRGYRDALMGINALAYDALHHGTINQAFSGGR